jgi:outer membrane protein TolC
MNGGGPDPMTLRMIGISQTIPYPGKLALDHAAAEAEVTAATAALDGATQQVTTDVQDAYAELVFLDTALAIVTRNHAVLVDFVRLAEGRYSVGVSTQADVLKAHVEVTRLADMANTLTEQRVAALARLNVLVGRPSDAAMGPVVLPQRILRAALGPALGAIPDELRFTSSALGARVANSPIPSVPTLQAMALRTSPELREQAAMIAAQSTRVALARKAHLPDVDVSLQYGQRPGRPDMLSASVAIPLPLSKRRRQDALTTDATAQLTALEADRATRVTVMNAEIARLAAELERLRAQLALYTKALLPQGRAAIASARANYEVGTVGVVAVLDAQATVFTYETEFVRAQSDFAKNLVALERLIGQEVVQ